MIQRNRLRCEFINTLLCNMLAVFKQSAYMQTAQLLGSDQGESPSLRLNFDTSVPNYGRAGSSRLHPKILKVNQGACPDSCSWQCCGAFLTSLPASEHVEPPVKDIHVSAASCGCTTMLGVALLCLHLHALFLVLKFLFAPIITVGVWVTNCLGVAYQCCRTPLWYAGTLTLNWVYGSPSMWV